MAMQILSEGSHAISALNTVDTIETISGIGVYSLSLDAAAMANGDVIEITLEMAANSTSAERQTYYVAYSHVQADPIKVTIPLIVPASASFKIKQLSGTARTFPWALIQM